MINLCNYDSSILNYIKNMQGEYADELLIFDPRPQIYWALSAVRREVFLRYPFSDESSVFIVGDKFGALTGILCEKAVRVCAMLPDEEHVKAVRKRYIDRENLDIITMNQVISLSYPYVIMNLEYTSDFHLTDTYEFDCILDLALEHMEEKSRLLVVDRLGREELIRKLLYRRGIFTYSSWDPSNNGLLLLEAGSQRAGNAEDLYNELKLTEDSQLLLSKWIQKYEYLFLDRDLYPVVSASGGREAYSEEQEWEYVLKTKLKDQDLSRVNKVKLVQVELLQKLISVCKENKLKVYPIYGTLLGAVRDGGMITGDDDIDVALPRKDYNKLIGLADEFRGKYFLQTPYNDDCFYGGYAKLRNRETTSIHPQNEWTDACEGISIDIFPIDMTCSNSGAEKRKVRIIRFLQRLLYAKSYGYFRQFKDMKILCWKAYKYIGKLFARSRLVDNLYNVMQDGDNKGKRHAIYCHYGNKGKNSVRYIDMSAFEKTIPFIYEGISMEVPSGWDRVLRGFYGEGYMNHQGFCEWKLRHGFYDVNVPYTVYKRRFGGLKHPKSIHDPIVLFGDGKLFKACLDYYKKKVNIAHLVQLPEEEPMKPIMGMPVESWAEFHALGLPKDSYRAIICSGDARLAEKLLKGEGYDNYYIFWQKRDWMLYANQSQIWKEIREMS